MVALASKARIPAIYPFVSYVEIGRPCETGASGMARQRVRICYDPEADYLEVIFDQKPGHFRETASHQVMKKVDDAGNMIGFSILRVSASRDAPLEVTL